LKTKTILTLIWNCSFRIDCICLLK